MIEIDGRDGGGQMLRTALTLSVLTQRRVDMINVRGDRENPGLKPQHIACIRILSRMTSGFVSGGYADSEQVTFQPRGTPLGEHNLDIGTAGSLPLLFDTLLPLGPIIDEPIAVTATGGTDVRWSPTFAYFDRVKLQTLRRFGIDVRADLHRTGFYPAGDGEATCTVNPYEMDEIDLTERGELQTVAIVSKASEELAEREVAERQCQGVVDVLEEHGIEVTESESHYVSSTSTGTSVLVHARYTNGVAGFDQLGQRGTPAEEVGADAAHAFIEFHRGAGAIDQYLGDQLMLPLAIAGGAYTVPTATNHMRSNAGVINEFGGDIHIDEHGAGATVTASASLLD